MNTDVKVKLLNIFLNKISGNDIQQYVKRTIHYNLEGLIPEMQDSSICKSITMIYHIKKLRIKIILPHWRGKTI